MEEKERIDNYSENSNEYIEEHEAEFVSEQQDVSTDMNQDVEDSGLDNNDTADDLPDTSITDNASDEPKQDCVFCVKCGYAVPSSFKMCPKCGTKIVKVKRGSKKILVAAIVILLLAVLGVGGYFSFNYYQDYSVYQEAIKLFGEKKYDEALQKYELIQDFKDVDTKVKETKYAKAEALLKDGKYDDSMKVFREILDYKDASYKVKEVEEAKENEKKLKELMELKDKFKRAVEDCSDDGTTLSSDGMSINVDSSSEYDFLSLYDVYTIVGKLGLPDSLKKEMGSTNSLMGRQEETYGDINVSWSFHPDNGLDVIFKIVK